MRDKKRIGPIITGKIIAIVIFLIMVFVFNVFVATANNSTLTTIVSFLTTYTWVVIAIYVLLGLGQVFFTFDYPKSTPAPLFSGIGSVLVVYFIFGILALAESMSNFSLYSDLIPIAYLIYGVTFLIVVISGYMLISSYKKSQKI